MKASFMNSALPGFRSIMHVAALLIALAPAWAATEVKTPGAQPINNPGVPVPIRMGLAQEWVFIPLPAGTEPLASSEWGDVVLLRTDPWGYIRWASNEEFKLLPDRNVGSYRELPWTAQRILRTIGHSVSKAGSIALNYQFLDGGFSAPGKIEEFILVWAPGSFHPRAVLGDFMPVNPGNFNDGGQRTFNSRRPGLMITLDGENYVWGNFAYRLSPTAPLREYPFRVNPNTEEIGQATLVAPDFQVMAVSRGAAHSVGVRFFEVSQDNGTVVRQPVAGTLDNAPLSFLPIYVNDNGVVLGAANLNQWNDPYVAATLVYSVQKGIRPLPVGGRVTWIDEQDRLHGFDAPTGGNPVMWVVKTAPDGSPLPQLEYVKVPYVPMPSPAGWVTDHLIPLGTRMPQLGKMTNSTTGQRRPFIAVRGGAPVDSNRDGQIMVGGSPSADAGNPTGPYFLPVNDKAGDGTPNWDDSRVNGANDLKNFYPVFLDIKALVRALPPSAKIKYRLKHADSAINYVLTDLTAATAFDFRQDPRPTGYGLFLGQPAFFAQTIHATWSGSDLFDPASGPPMFLNRILNHDGGVILIEARGPTDKPLVLSVEQQDSTLGTVVLTEIKLPLLTAGLSLAVDASRDGTIKFASEDDTDATSANRPYRFWSNDDIDRVHTVDGNDSEEDDLFTSPDGKLDWEENTIQSKRDLEDFARLQLYIGGLHEAIKGGQLHLGLKWTDVSGGSPSIKIYEHNSTDGSATYLTDPAAASAQLLSLTGPGQPRYAIRDARYQNDDPETSTHTLIEGTGTFILPYSVFVFLNETTPKKFLLFEGCNIGKGQLKIVILKKEGENYTEIGEGPGVWLDLKKIDQFYERWTAGDGNGGAPENTATRQKLLGRSGSVVSYGDGFEYPANATEEKKYILYVHGWNMQPEEKNRFAETAFKRLYWQGYKGRFGVFCWPTTYDFGSLVQDNRVVKTWLNSGYSAATDPTNYDRGEWAAWRSAFPLMQLLTSLRSNYTSVNVMAHSMGNVVAGEALRRLSNVGTSNVVDCYVASQAAVPAHTYDGSIPSDLLADVPLLTLIQYSDGGHPETPNIYPNWLAGNGVAAGRRVNFYNVNDYALWRDVWEANQFLKPDGPDDPDQPWTYRYLGDVNTVQDLFKRRTPVWTESLRLGTQTIPNDQFEIMAFAAESRSRAVGAEPERLGMTRSLDLTTIWPDDTGQRGSDGQKWGAHKWHSAQFRSTNMRQKGYWEALLDERGFNLRSSP